MPDLHPWAFERGALWAREYDGKDILLVTPKITATLSEAQPDTAYILARAMGLGDATQALQRFSDGRRCFVAWVDGAIASYGWVSRGIERVGELERSLRMSPDEAYIWDCATLPPYRGQRLYCALLTSIVATLFHDSARRIWIGASLDNTPSMRAFAVAGFQPVLRITYLRLFGLRGAWITGAPIAAPELVARARKSLAE